MSYIGNSPGVSSQRVVTEEVISGSAKSAFYPVGGYALGYVDVLINGLEVDSADFTAADGVVVTLATAAAVGDTVKIKAYIPRGLSDGYLKSEADAKFVDVTGDTMTGNLLVQNAAPAVRVQKTGGNEYQFKADTNDGFIRSATAGVDVMQFEYGGRVTLPQGQLRFPASQNASSDANTLDDYEEGTFTPYFYTDGTQPTVTYIQQIGKYVKVGKSVFYEIRIATNSSSGGTGNLYLAGMPFTTETSSNVGGCFAPGFIYNWASNPKTFIAFNANTLITIYISDFANTNAGAGSLNTGAGANYTTISGSVIVTA